MTPWKARRFWTQVQVAETAGGWGVHLDARPVRTPAKASLVVPTRALAAAIAAEWEAQQAEIRPDTMPLTRAANAAIDKVSRQSSEVADMLAGYGDSDLICYRAEGPAALVARQSEAWDPLLEWAESVLSARLVPFVGVMHHPQDPAALARLQAHVRALDIWALTAFHDLVSLSGSLVIGLAALHGLHPADRLWQLSRVDEGWQQELWGQDEEAAMAAERKESDFLNAKLFYDLSRPARN